MRSVVIKIILLYALMTSCYKPYDANIEANEEILVVDGMVTDEVASYHVRLSYASPFDSKGARHPVSSATVYVADDLGNQYPFRGNNKGDYISDSTIFTGQPGSTYTLYVETPDGESYMSDPQELGVEFSQDSIYAEIDYKETINRFNQLVVTIRGANLLVDIKSLTDTLPRFRFTSDLVELYFYALFIPPPVFDPPLYAFYCWQKDNSTMGINLTNKEYSSNSSSINRHAVYFIDDDIYVNGQVYELGSRDPDIAFSMSYRQRYVVSHRILYLRQYTLNNETYLYYKSMDELLKSEGKLFDPIASQLKGNIRNTSDKDKKVFGFFEASSVSCSAYIIGFRNHNEYSITKTPYIMPYYLSGCIINKVPPFWIN